VEEDRGTGYATVPLLFILAPYTAIFNTGAVRAALCLSQRPLPLARGYAASQYNFLPLACGKRALSEQGTAARSAAEAPLVGAFH
jgi:hypothetical protein